jgi:predicted dinucleotide-binding enzyme
MKIAVLGTGVVGAAIGTKLVSLGHEVMMGSRAANNPKALDWANSAGSGASTGTFAESIRFGKIVFNCVLGAVAVETLGSAGSNALDGKLVIDVSNPLDFSNGMPPTNFVGNTDSLGEVIQRTFPKAHIVKSLNTVAAPVMVNPALITGDHDIFVCGDDAAAKLQVTDILTNWFGWKSVVDLGDISASRVTEAWVLFWVRIMMLTGSPMHNLKIVR